MISNDEPLEHILSAIVKWVEGYSRGDLRASILLTDEKGEHLVHGAAPGLPVEYYNSIHGLPIGPNVRSCGAAAYKGESVIVEDIAQDPLWEDCRDLALSFGLRSCWSTPLLTKNGNVVGTFAIYHPYPHKPSAVDLQLIRLVSRTALLAIEYRKMEDVCKKFIESEAAAAKDMTLQKNLELELEQQVERRTQELQKLNMDLQNVNENLKQFAYVASHDLQEPLRKIKIYSDMLLTNQKEKLDDQGRMHLEKVVKSAGRMSGLIKDLLEFSRVNDDKDLLESVNLNELLNNIKVDFEVLIEQKKAIVNIDCLESIRAIPLQMNQLFFNLIGNALKFSKPGVPPIVDVWCRALPKHEIPQHYGLNPNYDYREIIVSDNGVGFNQSNADKVFEIFQRLHKNSDFEGTGIGLALCKKIVSAHEGAIHVRSEEGVGTTFYVVLPVARS